MTAKSGGKSDRNRKRGRRKGGKRNGRRNVNSPALKIAALLLAAVACLAANGDLYKEKLVDMGLLAAESSRADGIWAKSGGGRMAEDDSRQTAGELEVHFIDVGQGDATLLLTEGCAMLVDAGPEDGGTALQLYLEKQGVERLDYIIATHPDSDHIGGLDVVVTKFDCGTVLMPDIEKDSKSFRDAQAALSYKGLQSPALQAGERYAFGGAEFTVVAPNGHYEDANNNSIGILLRHGDNRFLFTGDAEEEAETDMLASGLALSADVYQVGHHGSRSSTGEAFLKAVHPAYAVISCGADNAYGHPHAEVLNRLRAAGVQVFRTDEQGSVVAVSDGEKITWNCSPDESWKPGE